MKSEKVSLENCWKSNRLILDLNDNKIKTLGVRKLCSPGEIIQLEFINNHFKLDFPAGANDC